MPNKNLTLGLGLLFAGAALAHHQTYGTQQGKNPARVAERNKVTSASLIENHLPASTAGESVRNPFILNATLVSDRKVDLSVPSGAGETFAKSKKAKAAAKHAGAVHVVREGENDWIIAHHAGVTTVVLKKLNPGIDLTKLHAGEKVNVPASAGSDGTHVASAKSGVKVLHSRYAVVNADSVKIRRKASTGSNTITQVDAGTRVVVLDREGEWYRLRFPHGTEGWVRGDFLKAASAPKAPHQERHETYVASRPAKHHSASSTPARYHRGQNGFVASTGSGGDASRILAQARSMRGVRYRWGAMSRSATDCSGFTSQVFGHEGYHLPRTSSEQATAGIPVHAKDLKPGDLVFFHTYRGRRVTHVGIYVGKGKFIHASSGGGQVQVNSLADGYYKERLVAARRVAKSSAKKATTPKKSAVAKQAPAKKLDVVDSVKEPAISTDPTPSDK